jgi:hypothetical protein
LLAEVQPHIGNYYTLKEIHTQVSAYLEEDVRDYYKTKTVSRHLTVLGFKDRKPAKGGMLALIDEDVVRAELSKRHVTPFDEDTAWFEGTRSYQTGPRPEPPANDDPLPLDLSWAEEL